VRRSQDGARFIPITFDGGQLIVAGTKAPLELLPGERTLKLNVFLDKSVMELFVNDRACYTRVIQPNSEDIGVALGASAGTARIRSFHAWKMRSIW
jgi:beta-fructofuranosidase